MTKLYAVQYRTKGQNVGCVKQLNVRARDESDLLFIVTEYARLRAGCMCIEDVLEMPDRY